MPIRKVSQKIVAPSRKVIGFDVIHPKFGKTNDLFPLSYLPYLCVCLFLFNFFFSGGLHKMGRALRYKSGRSTFLYVIEGLTFDISTF